FFFSSRRRHTRFSRDWSSDVCSSDLELIASGAMPVREAEVFGPRWREIQGGLRRRPAPWWHARRDALLALAAEGTPRYAYDLATVRARARQLAAVAAVDRRFYAIKANPHPAILRLLVEEG